MTSALTLLPVMLLATASDPVTTARAVEPAAVPSRLQLSVQGVWMPAGVVRSGASGERSGAPATVAYGLAPAADVRITEHLTLGVAVPVSFNVNMRGQQQAPATEVDGLLRLVAWLPVAPALRLYGFAAPGYYLILSPAEAPAPASSAHGLLVALGGGATLDVDARWFLAAEVGVQAGFNVGGGVSGTAAPDATVYLRTGVGAGVRF